MIIASGAITARIPATIVPWPCAGLILSRDEAVNGSKKDAVDSLKNVVY